MQRGYFVKDIMTSEMEGETNLKAFIVAKIGSKDRLSQVGDIRK